jgi:hypothetical protein
MNDSLNDLPIKPENDVSAPPSPHKARKGILCAKCEHLNPPGSDVCEYCHAHLFLSCKSCGHRNERVRTRCTECGHRLHRGFFYQLRRRLTQERNRYILVYLPLTILVSYLAYRVVIFLVDYRPR